MDILNREIEIKEEEQNINFKTEKYNTCNLKFPLYAQQKNADDVGKRQWT